MSGHFIFIVSALVFFLLALALTLPSLLRRKSDDADADAVRRAENIDAGRRRMRAVVSRRAAGEISAERREEYASEIENQLLQDMTPPPSAPVGRVGRGRDYLGAAFVAAVLAFVPPALYFVVGAPAVLSSGDVLSGEKAPSMEELIERLEQRLADDPRDAGALYWMGRLLAARGESSAAVELFRRAREVAGDEPDLLAAEAAALMQLPDADARTDETEKLLTAGLKRAAEHTTLLYLAGQIAEKKGDAAAAADYRRRARVSMADLPAETETRQSGEAASPAAVVVVHNAVPAAAASDGLLVVFARVAADDAPPFPLAVVRTAAEFPATVILDFPAGAKKSDFSSLDIVARLAVDDATKSSKDFYGEKENIPPGTTVTITINRAVDS